MKFFLGTQFWIPWKKLRYSLKIKDLLNLGRVCSTLFLIILNKSYSYNLLINLSLANLKCSLLASIEIQYTLSLVKGVCQRESAYKLRIKKFPREIPSINYVSWNKISMIKLKYPSGSRACRRADRWEDRSEIDSQAIDLNTCKLKQHKMWVDMQIWVFQVRDTWQVRREPLRRA